MPCSNKPTLLHLNADSGEHLFAEIETLHRHQLSAGALAHMPGGFLVRFYRMLAAREDCCVIAVLETAPDNRPHVSAFVAGSVSSSGLQKSLVFSSPFGVVFDAIRLLGKPKLFMRVASISRQMSQAEMHVDERQLLSIAVVPSRTQEGFGQTLVKELGHWFARQGHTSYDLIASETQTAALAFYERLGAQVVGKTDLGGLQSYVFRMSVSPD